MNQSGSSEWITQSLQRPLPDNLCYIGRHTSAAWMLNLTAIRRRLFENGIKIYFDTTIVQTPKNFHPTDSLANYSLAPVSLILGQLDKSQTYRLQHLLLRPFQLLKSLIYFKNLHYFAPHKWRGNGAFYSVPASFISAPRVISLSTILTTALTLFTGHEKNHCQGMG